MTATDRLGPRGLGRDCGDLATAVAVARDSIARGGTADLDALTSRLGALLELIQRTPGAEPAALRHGLLALAEEIEALGGVVGDECRRCSDELARSGASARAAAAYTKITQF